MAAKGAFKYIAKKLITTRSGKKITRYYYKGGAKAAATKSVRKSAVKKELGPGDGVTKQYFKTLSGGWIRR